MRRFFTLGLCGLLILPVVATVMTHAEDSTDQTETTTETNNTEDTKEFNDRIEKHKTEFKVKLTNFEEFRLKSRCRAAQGLIGRIKNRIKGIATSRTEVYTNVTTHLKDLSTKLNDNGVDTTELNNDINTLQTKIDTFNTDLATYKQAISDLVAINCQSDPDGFKAALEAARAAREQVHKDAEAVRTYLKDTIKPLLVQIRSKVSQKESSEGEQ